MVTDITDPNISLKVMELFTYYDVIYQGGTIPGYSSRFSYCWYKITVQINVNELLGRWMFTMIFKVHVVV